MDHIRKQVSASACSVLVMQHNNIVNEFYCGNHHMHQHNRKIDKDSRFNIASIRKTYLGLAISLAIHEGKIKSIDDYVIDYLYETETENFNAAILKHTTIRHLLTHTHGLQNLNERLFSEGTGWKYNNVGVNLLINVVENIFEQSLAQVLTHRVFTPLGLMHTGWEKEKNGSLVWMGEEYFNNQGQEGNLFVSTRDLAEWGNLHLNKGKFKGKQILPQEVFEQAVSIVTPSELDDALPRHGFFWWLKDKHRSISEIGSSLPIGSYQSLGIYGCALLIIPQHHVVVVRMLNLEANPPGYNYINDIQNFGNLVMKSTLNT